MQSTKEDKKGIEEWIKKIEEREEDMMILKKYIRQDDSKIKVSLICRSSDYIRPRFFTQFLSELDCFAIVSLLLHPLLGVGFRNRSTDR